MIKNDNNKGSNDMNNQRVVNNHGNAMSEFIKMATPVAIIEAADGKALPEELADFVTVTRVNKTTVLVDWA